MLFYTELQDFEQITVKNRKGKKSVSYDDNIFTLDTETTSIFIFPDRIEKFDDQKPPEYYNKAIPGGYMYIWTFGINDTIYYGRTGAQLISFLTKLNSVCAVRKVVYIHNQSFDFQFLRNYITDFEVFARSPRQPITAYSKTYNIECRDSLCLTNTKLAKLPDVFDLPVQKLVGDLEYNKIRNSFTPLTDKELAYCEHDNLVLYHCILKFKSIYKNVCKIPLTQTGIVRKECQHMYANNAAYHHYIQSLYPKTAAEHYFLMRALYGGYVHANYLHANKILNDITSFDFCSSYPTVMLCEKYQCGRFISSRVKKFSELLEDNYCYVLDITFTNINTKTFNHYLSKSKCYDIYHAKVDNGRIVSADKLRIYCTNIDLQIIRKCYKFSGYHINKALRARIDYLDRNFLLKILELYGKKTTLKDVAGKETEYMHAKQKLNSLYGMALTNYIKDITEFKDNEWLPVKMLTDSDVETKLQELAKSKATFLTESWGVFVTAYARRNLWSAILQCDKQLVYADTDSIKVIGDVSRIVDKYNAEITRKLKRSAAINQFDPELLSPADKNGIKHPLGVFENDGNYIKFITLGAKKYAYVDKKDSKLHLTLSGVNSKTGAAGLQTIDNFKKGFLFDYHSSGKSLVTYNDKQCPVEIIDEYGNKETRSELFGVNLRPNVYRLGIDNDFESYLLAAPNMSLRCSNVEYSDLI